MINLTHARDINGFSDKISSVDFSPFSGDLMYRKKVDSCGMSKMFHSCEHMRFSIASIWPVDLAWPYQTQTKNLFSIVDWPSIFSWSSKSIPFAYFRLPILRESINRMRKKNTHTQKQQTKKSTWKQVTGIWFVIIFVWSFVLREKKVYCQKWFVSMYVSCVNSDKNGCAQVYINNFEHPLIQEGPWHMGFYSVLMKCETVSKITFQTWTEKCTQSAHSGQRTACARLGYL